MSFLKINDPLKRDAIVKEYLELKKKIRGNFLSERIGEQQLQTDLSKFYKPITETQKATTREITEGLKPIREGIEKLPENISFEKTIKEFEKELEEEEMEDEEEDEEEEEDESVGKIARHYLSNPNRDTNFGIYRKKGKHYIGKEHVIVKDDDIIIKETGERFNGTAGLWGLITSKDPDKDKIDWNKEDYLIYRHLLLKTNAIHTDNNPYSNRPKR